MICEAEEKSFIKRTESAHGWDVVFYIFNFFQGYYAFYPDCPNWYWVVLLESLFQIMWLEKLDYWSKPITINECLYEHCITSN